MNFEFNEEQKSLKNSAIAFSKKVLNEDVIQRDKNANFSKELWVKCAAYGIQGLPFPEQYGGHDADLLSVLAVMEGLGYGCKDSGLLFAMNGQMFTVQMPIWKFGTETQKENFLPKLCNGEWVGAHGMTEPDSGSDAFALRTTAKPEGKHYYLNGRKTFSTLGKQADIYVVFASTDKSKGFMGITAFIVEKGFKGFSVSKDIEKMGLRTAPFAELILENCLVPVENRLGEEGNGAAIFDFAIEWERSCILASCIGAMERQIEVCIDYAKTRRQFGKPIGKYQSISHKIVDMKVRLEAARLLLYRLAWKKMEYGKATIDSAMAKLFISESWIQSCLDAVQIHGGYGYTTEYEIERDLRDSIGSTLYSGTSEIQRNTIAKFIGL